MHKYKSTLSATAEPSIPASATDAYQQAHDILFANPQSQQQQSGLDIDSEWLLYLSELTNIQVDPVTYWEVCPFFACF